MLTFAMEAALGRIEAGHTTLALEVPVSPVSERSLGLSDVQELAPAATLTWSASSGTTGPILRARIRSGGFPPLLLIAFTAYGPERESPVVFLSTVPSDGILRLEAASGPGSPSPELCSRLGAILPDLAVVDMDAVFLQCVAGGCRFQAVARPGSRLENLSTEVPGAMSLASLRPGTFLMGLADPESRLRLLWREVAMKRRAYRPQSPPGRGR